MVDRLIKVLDEDVALSSLAQSRVTLRPHDAAKKHDKFNGHNDAGRILFLPSTTLNERVIEPVESALAIGGVQVVDVGIAQGTTRNCITADTNAILLRKVESEKFSAYELNRTCAFKRTEGGGMAHLATGPMRLNISKSMASVTVGSSSPI